MDIVGRGFLAQNHASIAHRHPHVTMIAAGASSTSIQSPEVFQREREMVTEVMDRCRREGRVVVFFSTASHAMYGNTDRPMGEGELTSPASPFGRHKYDLERIVEAGSAPWLTIRLSHAVGPGQRAHQLFPSMVRLVRSGEVTLYSDNYRDLIDVDEVVRVVDALLTTGVTGELVNVATGVAQPIEHLVQEIEHTLDTRARKTTVDSSPMKTLVSVEKLHRLVPGLSVSGESGHDENYLRGIVRKYAACY